MAGVSNSSCAAFRTVRLTLVLALSASCVLFGLVGCGYHSIMASPSSAASGTGQAGKPTRIVVLALTNDSPEPWLDRIVTDALRREMSARGGFNLVDKRSDAELMLRGRIRPLDIRSKSFSGFVAALEYELTLVLDLDLVLASGQVVRLDPRMLSESDVYLASADIEVTRTNRLETLRRVSDLLSSRVADSIELIQRPLPASEPASVAAPVSPPASTSTSTPMPPPTSLSAPPPNLEQEGRG